MNLLLIVGLTNFEAERREIGDVMLSMTKSGGPDDHKIRM